MTMSPAESKFFDEMALGRFEIHSDGSVWRQKKWVRQGQARVLKDIVPSLITKQTKRGHLFERFVISGRNCVVQLHRVVFIYFFGEIPEGLVINHKNGVKTDNRPDNLGAVTQNANVRHAVEAGRFLHRHHLNHRAMLTFNEAQAIRNAYTGEHGQRRKLADEHGIPYSVVWNIIRGTTYKNRPEESTRDDPNFHMDRYVDLEESSSAQLPEWLKNNPILSDGERLFLMKWC